MLFIWEDISIHHVISDAFNLIYGVLQGSVILLLVLYTCPLASIAWRHGICIHTYTDDVQLYTTIETTNETITGESLIKLDTGISEIRSWLDSDLLKLNDNKTDFLVQASSHYLHVVTLLETKWCILVMYRYHQTSLSGISGSYLTIKQHITHICNSIIIHPTMKH